VRLIIPPHRRDRWFKSSPRNQISAGLGLPLIALWTNCIRCNRQKTFQRSSVVERSAVNFLPLFFTVFDHSVRCLGDPIGEPFFIGKVGLHSALNHVIPCSLKKTPPVSHDSDNGLLTENQTGQPRTPQNRFDCRLTREQPKLPCA
jgi:hypothetical protein